MQKQQDVFRYIRSVFKTSDQVQRQGAGRTRKRSIPGYVSIYRRLCCTLICKIRCESRASGATQPFGLRWGFETTSKRHLRLTPLERLLYTVYNWIQFNYCIINYNPLILFIITIFRNPCGNFGLSDWFLDRFAFFNPSFLVGIQWKSNL